MQGIHVAPESHPLHAEIERIVTVAGGRLVPLEQAEALIWLGHKESERLTDFLHPGIKWVQLRAAGVEKWFGSGEIDGKRLYTGLQGGYSLQVAEHAVALTMACAKELHHFAHTASWRLPDRRHPRLLSGATVAIVGAGDIGKQIIRLLDPYGMTVIAVTRRGIPVERANLTLSFDRIGEIWSRADYFILCAPSTPETRHLVGAAQFAKMKPGAALVNVGRGELVDSIALEAALRNGHLGTAAIDVVDPEPLPDGHSLWTTPRLLITPHTANPPAQARNGLLARIADNVDRYLNGRALLGVIDLSAGY